MSKPQFTCITCHVAFHNAQLQREHYKTDWHRYNLKRKVVALPPISVEKFKEKVAAQAQQALVCICMFSKKFFFIIKSFVLLQ